MDGRKDGRMGGRNGRGEWVWEWAGGQAGRRADRQTDIYVYITNFTGATHCIHPDQPLVMFDLFYCINGL